MRKYWDFYWPLALTGLAMLSAALFRNAVLARYPNATREIATFALAMSLFAFFRAGLVFVPQMANVLARSSRARSVCFRFTLLVCLVLSLPLVLIAYSPQGQGIVGGLYGITGRRLANVTTYLRFLWPLIIINGLRLYLNGLLVQCRRTGWVTVLNMVFLLGVISVLLFGFARRWPATITLSLSAVAPALLHLIISAIVKAYLYAPPKKEHRRGLTYAEAFSFFWPMCLTSTMFALSRPILYSFINRTQGGEATVAALRVGFDLAMIFHNPINQFRNLFATYGRRDPFGVRRFMIRIAAGVTAIMIGVAYTPISTFVFGTLLGVEETLVHMSRQVLMTLCLIPTLIALRNYFHGLSMVQRKTAAMGIGAIMRNLAIYLCAWSLFAAGQLNHVTAASTLMLGFASETFGVVVWRRLWGIRLTAPKLP